MTITRPIYLPNLSSLTQHRAPDWYEDAKFGIFIHWSVSSVPGFAPCTTLKDVFQGGGQGAVPYAEWYWNSLKLEGSPVHEFHKKTYGDRSYESFAEDFRRGIGKWEPEAWAKRFRAAGARYVVLVTKHHDGFCLWPSDVPHPDSRWRDWHAGRDVVGELADVVRSEGLRFGVYYSGGVDWTFSGKPLVSVIDLLTSMPGGDYPAYAAAQVRELISRVRPDVLWNDISWPDDKELLWQLIADYYNSVPDGLVNDRWMCRSAWIQLIRFPPIKWLLDAWLMRRLAREDGASGPPPKIYDHRTAEYAGFPDIQTDKWECVRGMDRSFGYNRNSLPEDFLSHAELLESLVDVVSKNGNLLLNVGPRGEDAQIPEVQLKRLEWVGAFLEVNGEAIYGSRPWTRAEGLTRDGMSVRFTTASGNLYACLLGRPETPVVQLTEVPFTAAATVRHLGSSIPPTVTTASNGDLTIEVAEPWSDCPVQVFCLGKCAHD